MEYGLGLITLILLAYAYIQIRKWDDFQGCFHTNLWILAIQILRMIAFGITLDALYILVMCCISCYAYLKVISIKNKSQK